jgi:hypothetical protein
MEEYEQKGIANIRQYLGLEATDKFPAITEYGGYPIVYVYNDGEIVCADCMNAVLDIIPSPIYDDWEDAQKPIGAMIFYEGAAEICANCGKKIESAYGDPDEKELTE